MHPEQEDRLGALRALRDAGGLPGFLRDQPLLAEGMAGRGPFARIGILGFELHRVRERRTLKDLAELLAAPVGTALQLASLDRVARQLLQLVVFHGGPLDRPTGLRLAGPSADPDALDAAATRLAGRLLTDPREGWVAPRIGVAEQLTMPGLLFREAARHTPNDVLGQLAFIVGAEGGTRKGDRIDALEVALRDPRNVRRLLERLDPAELSLFDALVAARGPVRVADVGIDWFNPRWVSETARPLHGLLARGLAGVASEDQHCWVWLDVQVALRGHVFDDWSDDAADVAAPAALLGAPSGLPRSLDHLDELLRTWEREPAPALKTGGLGVTPVRAAAKALGLPTVDAELLSALARHLGLLETIVVGRSGRGRSAVDELAWTTAPPVVRAWRSADPAERWALLLGAWRDGTFREPDTERWPDVLLAGAATLFLRLLLDLPDGRGLTAEALVRTLSARHDGLFPPKVTLQLLAELRALGVVPPDGPVGLTALGRAVLTDPSLAADLLRNGARHVVVQADHTVISPPDLHHEVGAVLAALAELESDAGARIHRITDASLHRAFERGMTGDDVLAFLREFSSTPVPSNVERLVKDAAGRFGSLRTIPATTVLVADDPALLARAASVGAAKLQIVAPTVAVSPLPETKVLAALKAKGLAAIGTVTGPASAAADRLRPHGHAPTERLTPVPPPQLVDDHALAELVDRLSEVPGGHHRSLHRPHTKPPAKKKPKGRP